MDAEFAYLFRHALLRDAAYELQLPAARARLHELALEIIEQVTPEGEQDAGAIELAEHARRALLNPALEPARQSALRDARVRYLERGAQFCAGAHRLSEAVSMYLQLADATDDTALRAGARIHAARNLQLLGRIDAAEETGLLALADARDEGAQALEARSLRGLVMLYRETGRQPQAVELLEPMLELLKSIEDPSIRADILSTRAALHEDFARREESLADYTEVVKLRRKAGRERAILWSLLNVGHAHAGVTDFAAARRAMDEALELAQRHGDDWDLGTALMQYAGLERLVGNLTRAVDLCERAAVLLRRCGNLFSLSQAHADAGGALHQQGLLEEARQQYHASLEIARELSTVSNWAVSTGNLALCCVEQGRFEEAAPLFDAVLDWSERSGVKSHRSVILTNRAVLEGDTGSLEKAIGTTNEALKLCEGGADLMFEAINLGNRARLYWFTGRLQEAREGFAQCLDMCERHELAYFEGVYRSEHAHFRICIGEPAQDELQRAAAALERVGNRREWAGRLAPALARQAILDGELAAADGRLQEAQAVLNRAGILESAYTARSVAEARASLRNAREGRPLFRSFRPQWFTPELRAALGLE